MSESNNASMYTNANSIDQALAARGEYRAGGTDLQERLRSGIADGPLVDIFAIEPLKGIEQLDGGLRIGALTTITALANDERVIRDYPALALPAQTLATPQTRNAASVGGALAQRTRCSYYRHPSLGCPKKGTADTCPSRDGDHHHGVVFDLGPCVYPHPSSIGCALLTYDALVEIEGRGSVTIAEFFGSSDDVRRDNALAEGELITAIHLPAPRAGERAAYFRQMGREHAEWPLVEVVVCLVIENDRIEHAAVAIGAVATVPLRLPDVEARLLGCSPDEKTLAAAATIATANCTPLPGTRYKVPMVMASVLEALERAVTN